MYVCIPKLIFIFAVDVKEGEQSVERDILDNMIDSIADLVVQAMKNCSSQEVILSRACLVLGKLSFRSNYKTALVETPECTEMLKWCLDTYEDNKLIQRCTRDTLIRLGQTVPAKPPKPYRNEEYLSPEKQSSNNNIVSNSEVSTKITDIETPQSPVNNIYADDASISSSISNQSSVIASSAKKKNKGFGFFRNKSKNMG